MAKASDIVSVEQADYGFDIKLWTVDGRAMVVGNNPEASSAAMTAVAIADIVKGWMEAGR